jgi:hypothetical protein
MPKILMVLIFNLLFTSTLVEAQEAVKPRPSPLEMVTMKYEGTYIKVTYCRPHKKGRVIFGELVPYGQVWRTGANEATEITFTNNVRINGKQVKAGTYTVFTIPQPDQWTIILNTDLGQWGAYNYNPEKDLLRFSAPVTKTDVVYEPFTIEFELQDDETNLIMMWDEVKVAFTIEFLD